MRVQSGLPCGPAGGWAQCGAAGALGCAAAAAAEWMAPGARAARWRLWGRRRPAPRPDSPPLPHQQQRKCAFAPSVTCRQRIPMDPDLGFARGRLRHYCNNPQAKLRN